MYRRMLVPLDGSELSEVVFPYIKELAARLDIEVVMLHVRSPEEQDKESLYQAYIKHKVEVAQRQMEDVRGEIGGELLTVRGENAVGDPAEEILRYVDESEADLVLMATHGRSGIRRFVMGSVAEKVLQTSSVPVLLVSARVSQQIAYDKWPVRRILVPLDGSELAESVLSHVETLAKQRGAGPVEVVLFIVCEPTVMPDYYPPSARFGTPGGAVHVMPRDYAKGETAKQKIVCEQYLIGVKNKLSDSGISVRVEVRVGKPAEEIIDYVETNPFHIIVMSTYGRSGFGRWAYGSVAAKVLQKSPSPVFLVRPPRSG